MAIIEWLEAAKVGIECRPKTYNKTSLFDVAGKCSVLGQETVSWMILAPKYSLLEIKKNEGKLTRMNQLSAVLNGNLDNFVASEISSDRGVLASLANDVGFIGL